MMNIFKHKPKSVGENESFAHLLRAAQDDPAFKATLFGLLQQSSFHRQSLLNTMATGMATGGVRKDVTRAVLALADDEVAARVLVMLKT
jgi:hypothetical protein